MPLPNDFNDFEFLQSIMRKWQNRIVKEEFSDLGTDDFDPDIRISRHALRVACTHKDDDTAEMLLMRNELFYLIHRKARDYQQPVYGIPTNLFQAETKFKPQVLLYFSEAVEDVEPSYYATPGEITFRVMDAPNDKVSLAKQTAFANKIKSLFGGSTPFMWRKGKKLFPYNDWDLGYRLKILALNEGEAKKVIEQVLDIQGHTPDWKKMGVHRNSNEAEAYPDTPQYEVIDGERVRLPRKRPICNVLIQYALLHIHGKPNPKCLYDRTGTFPNPLVSR